MQLTSQEQKAMEEIRNLAKVDIATVDNVFRAFMIYALLCYSTNEEIFLPYFGKWITKYLGDEKVEGGLEAKLNILAIPSDIYKQSIGEYEDLKSGKISDINDISIFKYFKKMSERDLKVKLNEE